MCIISWIICLRAINHAIVKGHTLLFLIQPFRMGGNFLKRRCTTIERYASEIKKNNRWPPAQHSQPSEENARNRASKVLQRRWLSQCRKNSCEILQRQSGKSFLDEKDSALLRNRGWRSSVHFDCVFRYRFYWSIRLPGAEVGLIFDANYST